MIGDLKLMDEELRNDSRQTATAVWSADSGHADCRMPFLDSSFVD